MSEQYAQGDILVEYMDALPAGARPVKPSAEGRYTIALGEATGHSHVVFARPGVEAFLHGEDILVRVKPRTKSALEHVTPTDSPTGEHDPITLSPGVVKFTRQQTFAGQRVRQVVD